MVDKEFLKSYAPDNSFFTSKKEMELIESVLKLRENKSYKELMEIRNEVVEFYSPLIDEDYDYMASMQSITAVIDNIIYGN